MPRKVNIPEFRKEVLAVIEANRKKITDLDAAKDGSIFTFCGKSYACEVEVSDKWIGYELQITTPEGTAGCGMQDNIDPYPQEDEDDHIILKIYDELLATIKAIFNGEVYYSTNEKFSYTAQKNDDGTYRVNYWERKKFLFLPYSSGWTKEYNQVEFEKLNLKVLS